MASHKAETGMSEIPESIWAMSRLNSWIRSASYRRQSYGGPRNAIYFLKRQAIQWADENLSCLHSTVQTITKCRGCAGTGRYVDSRGYEFDHCRACNNQGTLSLLFVQTAIAQGPIWHTPWLKFWIHDKKNPPYNLARWVDGDWSVNQAGQDRTSAEVAGDLNTVESFWTDRKGAWTSSDWGTFWHFDYRLWVGETENRCAFCGNASDVGYNYCVARRTIQWTDHACKSCDAKQKGTGDIYKNFPVPMHLIADPRIVHWMGAHSVMMDEIEAEKKRDRHW